MTLVSARGLRKGFRGAGGGADVTAVAGVDVEIARGETLGLVGESGSGKSTLGRLLLRLVEPDAGETVFDGAALETLSRRELRRLRSRMQIVFQDPYASLNPRMRVREVIAFNLRPLRLPRRDAASRVEEALELVALPHELLDRHPHQLSGGQAQRVAIARALVSRPEFVVADEAVSALDVSVQAEILNPLTDLRERLGLATLFISHNLEVVHYVSDRIAVMYRGHLVEVAPRDALYARPRHPYTQLLMSALPNEGDVHAGERLRQRDELRRVVAGLELGAPLAEVAPGHLVAGGSAGAAARHEEAVA